MASADTSMCWGRFTPTALPLVVSTVWQAVHKAASAAGTTTDLRLMAASRIKGYSLQPCSFQGIGKKEAHEGCAGRHGESRPGPRRLPCPAGEHCAERAARAIA